MNPEIASSIETAGGLIDKLMDMTGVARLIDDDYLLCHNQTETRPKNCVVR